MSSKVELLVKKEYIVPMNRLRFSLTSEQLELLLAFESSNGLNDLAETMARDPSVVSRNLQKIAEIAEVLKKVKGRWELTPLGAQTNELTRHYLQKHIELLATDLNTLSTRNIFNENSVLIIINAQNGLFDATQSGRNNSEAESNILKILSHWRKLKRPVVHVKHVSDNPSSMFYRQAIGCEILEALKPEDSEKIVEKTKSSAFVGTDLENILAGYNNASVVLVGFTANECIDSTARDSSAKGFTSFVVGNATATFDLKDISGKLVKAERLHKLTLANINAFYAKVIETSDTLK
jgi:nicotinamidase-related amidase